jgi:hypothetical protein
MKIGMVAAHPGFLVLRLASYPAWRITVNGKQASFDPADVREDGLVAVPVPQGQVDVTAEWRATPDVVAGRCVSGLAALLLVALGLAERRLSRRATNTRRA